MFDRETSVLIIGAGLAGLTTAATLAWRAGNGTERERQFAFVVGQSTCYLLTQTEASAGLYHVQALSAAGLLNYVQAQLQSMDQETIGTSGA